MTLCCSTAEPRDIDDIIEVDLVNPDIDAYRPTSRRRCDRSQHAQHRQA
jgi:hypothetical protein